MTVAGFELPSSVVALGAITGTTYGVLAVGVVLIYRSSRIINFAHGEMGALGAAVLAVAVTKWGVPYWLAFAIGLVVSAGGGALAELAVVRRLRRAPNVMSIVATLGLGQVFLFVALVINSAAVAGHSYPHPAGLPSFAVGILRLTPAHFGMLIFTPAVVGALVLFLKRSRFGIAIRATAANPESARLSGMFPGRMSMLAWSLAGALSAYTAILLRPTQTFFSAETLGPSLLLRALAAAVVARMQSLPLALGAGIGLGVVEQLLLWNFRSSGPTELALFAAILGALLLQRRKLGREDDKGSWAAVQPWPPVPNALKRVWSIRNLGTITAFLALAVAILLWLTVSIGTAVTLIAIMALSVVGLSLGVLTALAGQLSLGQFAFAGIGAIASYLVSAHTGNYVLGFLTAAVAAAGLSLVVGLPALQVRGLMLAVTTLSFALVATAWLFPQSWVLGEGVSPGRPKIGPLTFERSKTYYLFALAVLALSVWLARNIWRGGLGRRMRAVRDNEDSARAFTVSATAVKLQAFGLAGVLAGLGGALYGHTLSLITATTFPIAVNVNLIAMTALGGLGILAGPMIGALYIVGFPQFVPLDNAGFAASAVGWLILILYFPGGLAQLIRPLRERLLYFLARRAGVEAEAVAGELPSAFSEVTTPALKRAMAQSAQDRSRGDATVLDVRAVSKAFGGVQAVDGVSLTLRPNETLGLIGPNGAGKTTLFELISGFTMPDSGEVHFLGRNVTKSGPEARGKHGLIRSFQDAGLFPTLTVLEAVMLAKERVDPTQLWASLIGLRSADRRKEASARDIISLMGLQAFADKQIMELSTGTRRITELACLMALQPTVLLLDEPSSGIAQRETEALGELLARLRTQLDIAMVVIEHDMPLIMGLADRIMAMESGRVIADASPRKIQTDSRVIESYLGADSLVVERSGRLATVVAGSNGQCSAFTMSGERCSRKGSVDGLCRQHANARR